MTTPRTALGTIFAAALVVPPLGAAWGQAKGQSVADFYGKTEVSMIVGYNPGGTYDLYARMAARHLPRYLPGNPTIVVKNMEGVGSVKAANFLYGQAPRDGSTLGVLTQSLALQQVLKHKAVQYDARKFGYVGRLTDAAEVTIVWHTVPVNTIADARKREVILGATSPESSSDTNPRLMNEFAGTKFKIILGYKGTTGALNAMERGEVEGSLAVVQSLLVQNKEWIQDKKIKVLVQYTLERHPAFPDAPAMAELGDTQEEKEILRLYGSTAAVGRYIMTPPDVPKDRVAALRAAFDAMVKDPAFIKDMEDKNLDLAPMPGDKLQALIDSTFDISPKAAARAAAAREAPDDKGGKK